MSGALAGVILMAGGRFNGTLTVGNDGIPSAYGYVPSVYGSLAPTTFIDGGGTTRTIALWNWSINVSGGVSFRLSGTGISNSDTTFAAIVLGGRLLLRSAATYTSNDGGGRTKWDWSIDTSAYPSTGTVPASVQ